MHVSLYCVGKSARIPEGGHRGGTPGRNGDRGVSVRARLRPYHHLPAAAGQRDRTRRQWRRELWQLHVQIAIEIHRLGADANLNPNFQPHATLLCDKDVVPRIALRRPVVMAAREFVLLHNRRGQAGYEELGRWPLHARG